MSKKEKPTKSIKDKLALMAEIEKRNQERIAEYCRRKGKVA